MKKIAILFAGRVFSWEQQVQKFLDLRKKYDIDFYCSINGELDEYHKHFLEAFDIKAHVIQPFVIPENFDVLMKFKCSETNLDRMLSMYQNLHKVMQLVVDSGTQYDTVIYTRADMVMHDELILPDHIPEGVVFIPEGSDHGGICDQMAYGSQTTMMIYCDVYNNIEKYANEIEVVHPERMLMYHIASNGIMPIRIKFDYELNPARYVHPITGVMPNL